MNAIESKKGFAKPIIVLGLFILVLIGTVIYDIVETHATTSIDKGQTYSCSKNLLINQTIYTNYKIFCAEDIRVRPTGLEGTK